jgi:hypothetical protein
VEAEMSAIGDKFIVKMFSSGSNANALNVFYYESTGTASPNSLDLFVAFGSDIAAHLVPFMSDIWGIDRFEVINFDDPADFYSANVTGYTGAIAGDCTGPFNAWTFTYNRATRASRNGSKRFPGVAEASQASGQATAGALTLLNTAATFLEATISATAGVLYVPRIGRPVYPVPNPLHLPPTGLTLFPISGVSYSHIGTQNSRKY